ncbi:MAG: SDR family oxidoreductase [Rhizobiaceae bacterium]|nr:SDR family oxidoreductase [Rhizobiaceae bacterium]
MLDTMSAKNLLSLDGRVAIVTGSTRGIGLAVARKFAGYGASLIICGRAEQLPDEIMFGFRDPSRVTYVSCDLGAAGSAERIVAAANDTHGRLDILVNNAGIQPPGDLQSSNDEEWRSVLEVNVVAAAALMRCAAAAMTHGGSIINIASSRSTRPGMGMAAYSASKSALLNLTQSAAVELGPLGARVNAVSPGLVNRPGLVESWPEGVKRFSDSAPLGRIGEPEEIANACLFLAGDAASWITGTNLAVDGGITLVR